MEQWKLSDSECRLMAVIWEMEPVNSTELVRHCQERYTWKKSTTYTILKKLEGKGAVRKQAAVVSSLAKRWQIINEEGNDLLQRTGSSLPDFFAAFLRDRKLTAEEAKRISDLIESAQE